MPSTDLHRPPEAVAVADRYRRLERPISGAIALLLGVAVAVAVLWLPLVPGLLVAAVLVVVVRAPLFISQGTARLVADATPETVRDDFGGPTPPPLVFQWGVADAVHATGSGATYRFSYLFGLRSTTMTVETDRNADGDVRFVVTADGRPWATYEVTVASDGGDTVVDVTWSSDRRFGLNRVPQWLVAERYRVDALGTQGYTVVDRDATLSLSD